MTDYAALAIEAATTILEEGCPMTLRATTPGTYDPETGMESGATVVDHPCVGVVLPASKGTIEAFDNRFDGGTLIEESLRSVKMAAHGLAVVPKGGDILLIAGQQWDVLGCTPLAPDGVTNILYTLGVRRG